jgi:Tfp pilus assembly protein FimT
VITAALVVLAIAAIVATLTLVAACKFSGQIDTQQATLLEAHDAEAHSEREHS